MWTRVSKRALAFRRNVGYFRPFLPYRPLVNPLPLHIALLACRRICEALVELLLCPWLTRPKLQATWPFLGDCVTVLHARPQETGGFRELEPPRISDYDSEFG